MASEYKLNTYPQTDVITHMPTGLRVLIYDLSKQPFTPDPDELQLFASWMGRPIAFQTNGVTPDTLLSLSPAIDWYARKMQYDGLQLSCIDPRPLVN